MIVSIFAGTIFLSGLTAAGSPTPDPVLMVQVAAAKKSSTQKKSSSKKSSTSKKKTTKKSTSKKNAVSKSKSNKKSAKVTTKKKKKTRASLKKSVSKRWTNPSAPAVEQPSNDSLTIAVNSRLLSLIPREMNPGGLRVNKVYTNAKSKLAKISLNDNFTYLPVTEDLISELTKEARQSLPDSLKDYRISLNVGNHSLSYYITKVQPLPEAARTNTPFVVYSDPWIHPKKGMEGDILAVWHSHGRYYKPDSDGWYWQRPLLFQSLEDTFTMGFVLPFLVPMLENAGAYVMLPRERDLNPHEVIVDNDINPGGLLFSQTTYKEMNGLKSWDTGEEEGFIYDLPDFRDTENPFEVGTYRQIPTVRSGSPSVAAWYADIPEDGEYAVYVSYKTLPNSTSDAHYTVNYSGGSREFRVNQTMGGSTWIYLGTFPLEKGYSDTEPVVTLSNLTDGAENTIVTADAVKIGGGMGNIARSPKRSDIFLDPSTPDDLSIDEEDEDELEEIDAEGTPDREQAAEISQTKNSTLSSSPIFRTSGLPRFLEGARYWLHWAGFPESVYSPFHGKDDYKDDYTSRGIWVNYLAGGSRVLPDEEGLGIPIDMAMALHSDAGKRTDDSIVGTLGIYYTNGGDNYIDGTARINSRTLTDLIMRQIVADIRREWEPEWTRRSMWDKSYLEARVPEVPTALIELLSHQNFADMQYGLDPAFRFTVGRAIYKAMGRFMAERKGREFVVQPLPISDFSIRRTKPSQYRLQWRATEDKLEHSAKPTRYIILERSGDELGFHKVGETTATHFDVRTEDHEIHSFQIIAANEGGLAFPSETLAFREGEAGSEPVMIVNGFTRVSGPEMFNDGDRAGFQADVDFGVPYIRDISFTGPQTEFRRSAGESFGKSSGSNIQTIIAGNTFDFPAVHGASISATGRGFVSSSVGAVEKGDIKLSDYKIVDLILGRQEATVTGKGLAGARFHAFPEALRNSLSSFLDKGGRLIVSGENVATDPSGNYGDRKSAEWAANILGIRPDSLQVTRSGQVETTSYAKSLGLDSRIYSYSNTLNKNQYIVQHPDPLLASDGFQAIPLLTFSDNDANAAIFLKKGKGRRIVSSIPIESITDPNRRNILVKEWLDLLDD